MTLRVGVAGLGDRGIEKARKELTRLLRELGYDAVLVVETDGSPSINGNILDLGEDFPADTALDPASQILTRLACRRVALVAGVLAGTGVTGAERTARLVLAWLGVTCAPGKVGKNMSDVGVAALMTATDPQPLRLRIHPETVRAIVPDGPEVDVREVDEFVRELLFEAFALALPPIIVGDLDCPRGSVIPIVRDVRLPAVQIALDTEHVQTTFGQYVNWLVKANMPTLVTPAAAELALAIATTELPMAASLAERRWAQPSLADLIRVRISSLNTGPTNLAALVDWMSMAMDPQRDVHPESLVHLSASFPGIAAGLVLDLKDTDPSHELRTHIMSGSGAGA